VIQKKYSGRLSLVTVIRVGLMSETAPSAGEPEDDVKRRFREALERKQAKARASSSHENGAAKSQHTHGPVGGKRAFRRKSG